YCKALCDPRCCSSRKATRASPDVLVKVEEGCEWRNRFDSIASSTYQINGNRFFDPAGQGFMGVDSVQ
ncbi:aspartic protease 2, partial [Aphelenchoides avenae]